jgi:hypothetical protein
MTTKKMYDLNHLSEWRQTLHKSLETLIKQNQNINIIPDNSGPSQTNTPSRHVNRIRAQAETIFGECIKIGPDRPFGRGTGYGSKGANPDSLATETVDIAVGAMRRSSKVLEDGAFADPSIADAARFTISDVTDVDKNMGFCDGPLGNKKAQSAIGAAADQVRFFGYDGIQFSTGAPEGHKGIAGGITTALGGKVSRAPKIVFSAGNVDGTTPTFGLPGTEADEEVPVIQGIVKGANMEACIRDLADILDKLNGALIRMAIYQGAFAGILGITIPPGIQPHHAAAAGPVMQETFGKFIDSIIQLRLDKVFWNNTYVSDGSPKRVSSTNVFTS